MSSHDDAHPRFAEALRALGLQVEVRRFPDATIPQGLKGQGGTLVDVREQRT